MSIRELLALLNCSEGEKSVFLALLGAPRGLSVVGLHKKLTLPRPTLYGYVEGLLGKGLVRKGLHKEGAIFYAEDEPHIKLLFEEKILDLEKAKQSVKNAFSGEVIKDIFTPRFTVYEGNDTYAKIFRDMLISDEHELYWIWPLSEMLKHIPEKALSDFHTERVLRGIWLSVLWPKPKKISLEQHPLLFPVQETSSLRRIKILPAGLDQTLGYGVYGSKVAFLSSERENYAFVIESKELSDAYKSHFQFLWKLSKKYSQ
jgi:sugar-specific transcriptional regulator TrmB